MSLFFGTPCVGRAHFTSVPRFPSEVSFRESSRHTSLLRDTDRATHPIPPPLQLPSETQKTNNNNNNKQPLPAHSCSLVFSVKLAFFLFSHFPLFRSFFTPLFPTFPFFLSSSFLQQPSTPPPQQHHQHFFSLPSHTFSPPSPTLNLVTKEDATLLHFPQTLNTTKLWGEQKF